MASTVLPERFASGDFSTWLRHFTRCALANEWSEATQLVKLPAFLQGPAASYYDSLAAADKASLGALTASLKQCFSPAVDQENFYREFEDSRLRPAEDPNLFLWRLKELLRNAEPSLTPSAFNALLRRQFMRGIPSDLRLKILEANPTPTLENMLQFSQRFRALRLISAESASCATAVDISTSATDAIPQQQQLERQQKQIELQQQKLDALHDALQTLSEGQTNLVAAISTSGVRNSQGHGSQRPSAVRCFLCHTEGHIVRNCPKRRDLPRCNTCLGWGHLAENCANNTSHHVSSKSSLNFQGVSR